jgi:hypothetical protein
MTKPDEELGLDPVLFANRLEKRFEAARVPLSLLE